MTVGWGQEGVAILSGGHLDCNLYLKLGHRHTGVFIFFQYLLLHLLYFIFKIKNIYTLINHFTYKQ